MVFAFLLDAHSRRVVGWQFASQMRTTVADADDDALAESFVDSFKTEPILPMITRTN